ncbi:FAD-dependent oxidoreductase [Chloroflexota bacterium]
MSESKKPTPPTTGPATVRNIIQELPLPGQRKVGTTDFACDVLVVGAGYAGTMAALRAQALGQKVIVVCKQIIGKSGLSPWANTQMFFDPTLGDRAEDWIAAFQSRTEYVVDLDYLNLFMRDSLAPLFGLGEIGY